MAHVDPARAVKRSALQIREMMQAACRETPCRGFEQNKPLCVVCVHEGKIRKSLGA